MTDNEQEILLKIVETWRISEMPEYRGFRCASCQQYKNEAWHHWLVSGGYLLPVHLCKEVCETDFRNNTLKIDGNKKQNVDRKTFGNLYKYKPDTIKRFKEITKYWTEGRGPQLKVFTCDECGRELNMDDTDKLIKGFHVWWKMDDGKTLAELHFHNHCAIKIGLVDL